MTKNESTANAHLDAYKEARRVFVEMQNSPHTQRAYDYDIRKWEQFADHVSAPYTSDLAVAFKKALEETYAPSTAQRIWSTVAAFYGWMKGTGRISDTPFHGIKSPTRPIDQPPPVPSDQDIADFFIACENGGTRYGWRAALAGSLLLNGLRAQEVCDARIDDLKYDTDYQAWILTVKGKGDKYRRVPLNSEAQQQIFDYYINMGPGEWLVPNDNGGQLNTKAVYRLIAHFGKKAGIENLHPHALRHHYATRLVRGGIDLFTLQKLLGHTRADTTQRYVGLDNNDLVKALEADNRHEEWQSHMAMPYEWSKAQEVNNEPVPF